MDCCGVNKVGMCRSNSTKNSGGWTPLMYAAVGGHYQTVKHLLKNAVALEEVDNQGNTALMHAILCGHLDVYGANTRSDGNLLILATSCNHLKVVSALLQFGIDVNARSSNGMTSLMVACRDELVNAAELLIQKGANPYLKMPNGKIAANFTSNPIILKLLRSVGATIGTSLNLRELESLLMLYNLDEFTPFFQEHEIDLKKFLTLNAQDFKDLKITFGPRKQMLAIIEKHKKKV